MPERRLEWSNGQYVYIDTDGEACEGDCIALVDDYPDLSRNQFTWPRRVWEELAEVILAERDRRKEEEAKQPKRWVVNLKEGTAELSSDQSGGRGQNIIPLRDGYDEADGLYVWAHNEKDARERAREANHSLGVWIREYLA